MRELKDPLIPSSLYAQCIDLGKSKEPDTEKTEKFNTIQQMIPETNFKVVMKLAALVDEATKPEHSKINRMTYESMAIVLSPSFLRSPADKGDLMSMSAMQVPVL